VNPDPVFPNFCKKRRILPESTPVIRIIVPPLELIRQNKRKQMKEQVLNITSKEKKNLANMLYQAHTNCSKQASLSKSVIIQLKSKILSEGVMTTNFISKSLEFIQLLICKNHGGYFCLNEMRRKIAKVL